MNYLEPAMPALKNLRQVLLKNSAFTSAITKNKATTAEERQALTEYHAAFNACVPLVNAAMVKAKADLPSDATRSQVFFSSDSIRCNFNATVAKYKAEARKQVPPAKKEVVQPVQASKFSNEEVTFKWSSYELSEGGTQMPAGTKTVTLRVLTLSYKGYERKLAEVMNGFVSIRDDNTCFSAFDQMFKPWNDGYGVMTVTKHKNALRRSSEQHIKDPKRFQWTSDFSKMPG